MFNLVKYEIKGIYKSLLAILIALTVLFAASMIMDPMSNISNGPTAPIALGVIYLIFTGLGIATFIIVLINSIRSLSKYLYGSEGYLMFTTPESGASIIGSRLIISILQIVIVNIAFGVFFYFTIIREVLQMADGGYMVKELMWSMNPGIYAYFIIAALLGITSFLLTIYFSMLISKSLIPFQKHQGLIAFITFIVVNIVIQYVGYTVSELLPINLQLQLQSQALNFGTANIGNFSLNNNTVTLSLGSLIFSLIASVLLFLGSAYLIDNKLEL